MNFLWYILFVIFIVLIGSFVKQYQKRKKQPPGPLALPFFGEKPLHILLYLFPNLFPVIPQNQYFLDMKNKYGDIWSTDLGNRKIVVLASIDVINEAYVDNAKYFQARTTELFKLITEKHGVVLSSGEIWNANRQLAIKSLRDLGMGKRQLETQINEEVYAMMETIEQSSSGYVSNPLVFIKPISNVTFRLIFNEICIDDNPELDELIEHICIMFNTNEANVIEFIPKSIPLKYIRKFVPEIGDFLRRKESSIKIVDKLCRDRIKVESEFSKPSCIFDYFWRYRYQDYPNVDYDEKLADITQSMFDLVLAGVDTTKNLLAFCCLLLGKHRDVQEDLRKEFLFLIDDYKMINMEMRKNCPKFLSFIDEVQRTHVLSPRILRRVVSNCVFRNYEITTDDMIFGDINSAFKDPALFENPDRFDAYRFLDESRTKYTPNKNLIPFGTGKRTCLGESIGVMELFLFLSRIIIRYDISLPKETVDNFDKISEGIYGLIHAPLEHKIILQIRNI